MTKLDPQNRQELTALVAILLIGAMLFLGCQHAQSVNREFSQAQAVKKAEARQRHENFLDASKEAENEKQEKRLADLTYWLDFYTGILALGTVVLALLNYKLVAGADKTAERQLRAYVLVEKVNVESLDPGQTPLVIVTIKNSGQTPAENLKAYLRLGLGPYEEMGQELPTDKDEDASITSLGSASYIYTQSQFDRPFTAQDVAGLKEGQTALCAFGKIEYWDVFQKHRVTEFKVYVGGPMGIRDTMVMYKKGNWHT